jgi:hypothetical protein
VPERTAAAALLDGAAAVLAMEMEEEEQGGGPPSPPEESLPQPSPDEAWAVNGTCHRCWTCPGASGLRIRGRTYLRVSAPCPWSPACLRRRLSGHAG